MSKRRDLQRSRKVYSYVRPTPRFAAGVIEETLNQLDWKQSVRVATTSNIGDLTAIPLTIDGYTLTIDDRVLVKDQSTASENGIYVYGISGLTRSADATQDNMTCGAACFVELGIVNEATMWYLATNDPITVGSTSLVWLQFFPYGSSGDVSASIFTVLGPKYAKTTSSVSFDSDFRYVTAIGDDVFFFVSGSVDSSGVADQKSVFGGDMVVSGSFFGYGDRMEITGTLEVTNGISGSLTQLTDGTSYLVAGTNITITSQSNGSILIDSTGGGGGDSFFVSTTADSIFTTGSAAFRGNETGIDSPADKGTDVFFYVSGSTESLGGATPGAALFGGDVRVSGSLLIGTSSIKITSNDIQFGDGTAKIEKTDVSDITVHAGTLTSSGTLKAVVGLSGSLTQLVDGTSYLVAGTNVTITSQSNGSVEISSTGGGGGGDSFFASTTAGSIFTTGSAAFRGAESAVDSPNDKGTDVFFYVSGSGNSKNGATPGVALFGGDVTVSGSLFAEGDRIEVSGTLAVTEGISGSLTQLSDGTSYLIAGANITITSQSNGSVLIASTGGGGDSFFASTTAGSIFTTGSAAFRSGESAVDSPLDKGADVFFYVSGSGGTKNSATPGVALFGGDVTVSGSLYTEGNRFEMSGTLEVTNGISGSLTQLVDGTSYLVAGTNITITSQSNGSILIDAIGDGVGDSFFVSTTAGSIFTTGSAAFIGGETSVDSPLDKGTDVFFYVSGSTAAARQSVSVFGGTVFISGSMMQGNFGASGGTTAQFARAHGERSSATGIGAHAEGRFAVAQGQYSHAEGDSTYAAANGSHAEGLDSATYGGYSHAEGRSTDARADYSHTEGRDTETIIGALYSHAEGSGSIVVGIASHAEGLGTIASGSNQLVIGKYNLRNNNSSLFVIGAGTADGNANRRDVIRVESSSLGAGYDRLEVTGSLTVGTTLNSVTGQAAVALGNGSSAIGWYSLAQGQQAVAANTAAHAEGYLTNAAAAYSHAEGEVTTTSGETSHAEGQRTLTNTNARWSHAEGSWTQTFGRFSHAEGTGSIAYGDASHAQGYFTEASGTYSMAAGFGTIASGSGQVVVGKYNQRGDSISLFVVGDGTAGTNANRSDVFRILSGSTGGTGRVEVTGSFLQRNTGLVGLMGSDTILSPSQVGRDVFFYVSGSKLATGGTIAAVSLFGGDVVISGTLYGGSPLKIGDNVLITGSVSQGTNAQANGSFAHAEGDNITATGAYSHAEGLATVARSDYSHAEGRATTAWGDASHAEGLTTVSSGSYSHAEGHLTITTLTADYSHAEGYRTIISGTYAHAEGYETIAAARASHAEGSGSIAYGIASHAEGGTFIDYSKLTPDVFPVRAYGNYSHAEGVATTTNASGSHAEGYFTTADGLASHAEGSLTIATANYSHTEGLDTQTLGTYSHAEGYGSIAEGVASHAEGYFTKAYGNYSHASGLETVTSGAYQVAVGKYNVGDVSANTLFIIGNGTSNAARADALKVTTTLMTVNESIQFNASGTESLILDQGIQDSTTTLSTNPLYWEKTILTTTYRWAVGIDAAEHLQFYYGTTTTLTAKGYLDDAAVGDNVMNFTGQHRCVPDASLTLPKEKIGLIVKSSGVIIPLSGSTMSINDATPTVLMTTSRNDKAAFGVISDVEDTSDGTRRFSSGMFVTIYEADPNDNRVFINSLGEGCIWVCNVNGNLENGDYITTCEVPGYGMKQDDDLLHNYTVAKITMDCTFDLNSTAYTCEEFTHEGVTYRRAFVACTYHCG